MDQKTLDGDGVYHPICKVSELPPGERIFFEINDHSVVLINLDGECFAIGDICTHDDGPLGDGEIEGDAIICPRHGARFDIRTGKVLRFPAVENIPTYPVKVENGVISIKV